MATTIGPDISWRVVHDSTSVVELFQSSGYTSSTNTLVEFATEDEARAYIVSNNLTYTGPTEDFGW